MIFRREWSPVGLGEKLLPGEIKVGSAVDLRRLQEAAMEADGVSATGRHKWLAENYDGLQAVYFAAFSIERAGWIRCFAVPRRTDGSMVQFTVGMTENNFARLRTISWPESGELLHLFLRRQEWIPLDPGQETF